MKFCFYRESIPVHWHEHTVCFLHKENTKLNPCKHVSVTIISSLKNMISFGLVLPSHCQIMALTSFWSAPLVRESLKIEMYTI